jgi:tripartite-type tricarboxylate transporter receptor subunit TctC
MNARVIITIAATLLAHAAWGQTYPNRPVRLIPGQPGGGAYVQMLLIRDLVASRLGQPLIMDARPAALMGGIAARAPADGYTMMVAGTGVWFQPLLQKTDYDMLNDFVAISTVGASPSILVIHPSLAVNSVKELIALAKSRPGALNYSSAGTGSSYHLAGELFKSMTGADIVRVSYVGAGPTIQAVIAGEVQMSFGTSASVAPHIKAGRLRALAHTGPKPTPLAPGLPSMAASGLPGFEITSANAVFAPVRTPVSIIRRWNQELVWALSQPDVKEKFLNVGAEAGASTPEEITTRLKSDYAKVEKLVKSAGISAN